MNSFVRKSILAAAVTSVSLGGLFGCVVRVAPEPVAVVAAPPPPPEPAPAPPPPDDGGVVVQTAPPPDIYEAPPPPPGPAYVWVGGFWWWNGYRYDWRRGHYDRPHPGYHMWVRDRWVHGPRGYVYVRGHWG
jgi:hypothetical protein